MTPVLQTWLAIQLVALQQNAAEARRQKHTLSWRQPGPKNRMKGYGRYTGEVLRQLRAERGVGSRDTH